MRQLTSALVEFGDTICDTVANGAEELIDYKKGQPSWLRLVTIPFGAVILGACFVVAGLIDGYSQLAQDISEAREKKRAAAKLEFASTCLDNGGVDD